MLFRSLGQVADAQHDLVANCHAKRVTMKTPLSVVQHIKTMDEDHGLNRASDEIVIWLQLALESSSGSVFLEPMLLRRKQSIA